MKNPLIKRLPRELTGEIGKYIVIFILLIASIGMVSGFLVADGSLIKAYNDSFEKYNIENGNLETVFKVDESQRKEIEKLGIKLYENYYVEESVSNDSTMRIFKNREEVNKICLMDGDLPSSADEIAIDRMYADNNKVKIGDSLKIAGKKLKVTGLVALSDYSALFQNNSDTMFDSVKFGVAIMTKSGFESFGDNNIHYSYSFKYDNEPKDDTQEKEVSDKLMKDINAICPLQNFVPKYANQAINFTGDDMGGDRSMMITLLYIIIVILAFVFGVTISNTIAKEANVIGTLRASGYTKGELVRHYMAMPIIVTAIGAVIGNILGYTVIKDVCANLYYGSYSLPTYKTIWNGEAFLLTTVIPIILMFVITLFILLNKLSLSPLKFLRRDLKKHQKKKAFKLNTKIKIFTRFRLRIIFQNISNYVTLFIGIIFANLLLIFGLCLPSVLGSFQDKIVDNMLAENQYILKAPMETQTEGAEKFEAATLITTGNESKSEEILLYGVEPHSRYVGINTSAKGVYISDGYAEKYGIEKGDTITLKEQYGDKKYKFKVSGTYSYPGALSVFMDIDTLNETLGNDKCTFNGYFSNEEITDIDEKYIATVIDEETLTKLSRQLDVSMGNLMYLVDGFSVLIFVVLIYLLSKIIIEKNAQSISMTKILGYTNGEISRLYIASTSILVVLFILISLPIDYYLLYALYTSIMMTSMSGWITFELSPMIFVEMIALGVAAYAVVAALEYRRIKKIPMGEALKNAE